MPSGAHHGGPEWFVPDVVGEGHGIGEGLVPEVPEHAAEAASERS